MYDVNALLLWNLYTRNRSCHIEMVHRTAAPMDFKPLREHSMLLICILSYNSQHWKSTEAVSHNFFPQGSHWKTLGVSYFMALLFYRYSYAKSVEFYSVAFVACVECQPSGRQPSIIIRAE